MRHTTPLPSTLGPTFAVRDARAIGIGQRRLAARDLHRPFHGVRSETIPATFEQQVACYRPRMKAHNRLGGLSALRLWGLPVPHHWWVGEPLEIMAPTAMTPPRAVGVRGRRLGVDRASSWRIRGVAVVDPVAALFLHASALTVAQAVVIIDALLTTADNYPGLLPARPLIRRDEIAERLQKWGSFPGRRVIREALALSRECVESPKETQTRMLIVASGLPEPVVQCAFRAGRSSGRADLAYPQWKIAVEYEGDGHRVDRAQWRRDIQRQRDLEDAGWIVIRVTELDLRESDAFLARLRRAIMARSSSGS